jgi:DUF971 family protein
MPLPLDERKKPASVRVHISSGEGVEITWSDGHASRYTFPYLRDNCPCAMCNDEREKKSKAGKSAEVFPMFKPRVTAKSAQAVGNYAIQIEYSDGHSTGIYSFDYLREICPCEDCQREFGAAVNRANA